MKRVLVIYSSQSGQLARIVAAAIAPLQAAKDIEVSVVRINPLNPYPFPWPLWRFFNTFPETVYDDCDPIETLPLPVDSDFDLVILAYQVWFLSPSLPVAAFLQSEQAAWLLRGKPVITLIGCRNMWLMAQERMKAYLRDLDAHLIDNIALTDRTHVAATFISTPLWMLTGKRGPFLGGLIPAAGVPDEDIAACARFGSAIAQQLPQRRREDFTPMLSGLAAVTVNERLIASEKIAMRSFRVWGGLLRALGKPEALGRRIVLGIYILFLITLILTVVPISAVLKRIISPLTRARVERQRAYFSAPSGEGRAFLEQPVHK